jgi:hypothetical protein
VTAREEYGGGGAHPRRRRRRRGRRLARNEGAGKGGGGLPRRRRRAGAGAAAGEEYGGSAAHPRRRRRRRGRAATGTSLGFERTNEIKHGREENASGQIPQDVELETGSFGSGLRRPINSTSILSPNAQPEYLSQPNT